MAEEKEVKKTPASEAKEPTKTIDLGVGQVVVCPKGSTSDTDCFVTSKSDWDRVYSKQGDKYTLKAEKKN